MRVGILCSGLGQGADAEFMRRAAQAAERAGFSTIWHGEHVVLFDSHPRSKYPYAGTFGGEVPFPDPRTPVVDPVIAMTWSAAATTTIEVASGIVILPQRNPVVLAKELATLDMLSGGRVLFGAGLGWCREEYDAVGVPWPRREQRMVEYVQALRRLWQDESSSFAGETVDFDHVYLYPKPVRGGDIPILFGGESDQALIRVASFGDGWLVINLPLDEAASRIRRLRGLTEERGRDPARLRIIKAVTTVATLPELEGYREAGVSEFQLLVPDPLPHDEVALNAALGELAERFVTPLAS